MASEGHDGAAQASGPGRVVGSRLRQFTLFPRLPPELRIMVWELAMQRRRLVHLRARGCAIRQGTRRRGCPRSVKPTLTIYGTLYEQVPIYFFVNYECRQIALKKYSILFSAEHDRINISGQPDGIVTTNVIMSPRDILVSWYTERVILKPTPGGSVRFGPEACRVRNIMALPWLYDPVRIASSREAFQSVGMLVRLLSNINAIENLFFLGTRPLGPFRYRGPSRVWGHVSELGGYVPYELGGSRLFVRLMEHD